ncbi:MAG: PEP/pyruvate-binding domain-containing protein [Chitinophagales bacterium]
MKYTLFFNDATEADYELLGGKGKSLASMSVANFPVPNGFCVTTTAYSDVMKSHLEDVIDRVNNINVNDMNQLASLALEERKLVESISMPEAVENDIRLAYQRLCKECGFEKDLPVAVRSSATAEDLPDASFAGQQDTYLWVVGEEEMLKNVRKCWASLFTARAIRYRHDHNIKEEDVLMSVVVQKMVNSKVSGVAMTLNPMNGDRSKIVIDAGWGLGESVVSGEVTPDNYMIDKVILEIVKQQIHDQEFALVPDFENRCVTKKMLGEEYAGKECLSLTQLKALGQLCKTIEKHYQSPQDIEWALDGDLPDGENLTLLQSRPETVWSQKKKEKPTGFTMGMEGLVGSLLNPINKKKN